MTWSMYYETRSGEAVRGRVRKVTGQKRTRKDWDEREIAREAMHVATPILGHLYNGVTFTLTAGYSLDDGLLNGRWFG